MAFFTPLSTGQYSLFMTSNDQGELLMSDQPNITNATRSVMCNLYATPLTLLATPLTLVAHLLYYCYCCFNLVHLT